MPPHLSLAAGLAVFALTGFAWMLAAGTPPAAGGARAYALAIGTNSTLRLTRQTSGEQALSTSRLACRRLTRLGHIGIGTGCVVPGSDPARIAEAD